MFYVLFTVVFTTGKVSIYSVTCPQNHSIWSCCSILDPRHSFCVSFYFITINWNIMNQQLSCFSVASMSKGITHLHHFERLWPSPARRSCDVRTPANEFGYDLLNGTLSGFLPSAATRFYKWSGHPSPAISVAATVIKYHSILRRKSSLRLSR